MSDSKKGIEVTESHFKLFSYMHEQTGKPEIDFKAFCFFRDKSEKADFEQFIEKGYIDIGKYRLWADLSITRERGSGQGDLSCTDGSGYSLPYFDRLLQKYLFLKYNPERIIKIGMRHDRKRHHKMAFDRNDNINKVTLDFKALKDEGFKIGKNIELIIINIPDFLSMYIIKNIFQLQSTRAYHKKIKGKYNLYVNKRGRWGGNIAMVRGFIRGRRRSGKKDKENAQLLLDVLKVFRSYYYNLILNNLNLNKDEAILVKSAFTLADDKKMRMYRSITTISTMVGKHMLGKVDIFNIRFHKLIEITKYFGDLSSEGLKYSEIIEFYKNKEDIFNDIKQPRPRKNNRNK